MIIKVVEDMKNNRFGKTDLEIVNVGGCVFGTAYIFDDVFTLTILYCMNFIKCAPVSGKILKCETFFKPVAEIF